MAHGLVVMFRSLASEVLGSNPDHKIPFYHEKSWMRSAGECLIVNLFTQWLKELDECLLGKVKGLLEHLGSNFST